MFSTGVIPNDLAKKIAQVKFFPNPLVKNESFYLFFRTFSSI